jgi:hypothetical protein
MREDVANKKISQLLKHKKRTDTDFIKMISNPFDQQLKSNNLAKYKLDPITASSLMVATLNPTESKSHFITGEAPKVYRNNIICINNVFLDPTLEIIYDKKYTNINENFYQGQRTLMEAQIGFDLRDSHRIYHNLQFAIDHFEKRIELNIAKFYFLVAQYIYENHEKVLSHVLYDFSNLLGNLPEYLNDHCLLFINRLENILGNVPTVTIDQIRNEKLREIYILEDKIPQLVFHFTTKKMMLPRIDLFDIIYIYTT